MTKIEIANLLGITESDITDDIISKIERIEKEGFVFKNYSIQNLVTEIPKDLEKDDLEYLKGKKYKILTFENEDKKRYCILDNENNLVKLPLSRLHYYDSIHENEELIVTLETLQQNFKDKGIEISKYGIVNTLSLEKVNEYISTYGLDYFEYYFNDFYEILNKIDDKETFRDTYHELINCGTTRACDKIYDLSNDFIFQGIFSVEKINIDKYNTFSTYMSLLKQKELQRIKEDESYIPSKELMSLLNTKDIVLEKIKEHYLKTKDINYIDESIKQIYGNETKNMYRPIFESIRDSMIDSIEKDDPLVFVNYYNLQKVSKNLKILQENFDIASNTINASRKNILKSILKDEIHPEELLIDYDRRYYDEDFDLRDTIQKGINFIISTSKPEVDVKDEIINNLESNKVEISQKTKEKFEEFYKKYSLDPEKYFNKRYFEEKIPNLIKKIEGVDLETARNHLAVTVNEYFDKQNFSETFLLDLMKEVKKSNPELFNDYFYVVIEQYVTKNYEKFIQAAEHGYYDKKRDLTIDLINLKYDTNLEQTDNFFESIESIKEINKTIYEFCRFSAKNHITKRYYGDKDLKTKQLLNIIEDVGKAAPEQFNDYILPIVLKNGYKQAYASEIFKITEELRKINPELAKEQLTSVWDEADFWFKSKYTPEFLEQLRLTDNTKAINFINVLMDELSIEKTFVDNIPALMKQISLVDKELAKELIPELIKECSKEELFDLIKEIKTIDYEKLNKYMSKKETLQALKDIIDKDFENCVKKDKDIVALFEELYIKKYSSVKKINENSLVPDRLEKLASIDKEKAKGLMSEAINICYGRDIPKLITAFAKIDPENTKDYITQDIVFEAIESCASYEIPALIKEITQINTKNPEEFLTQNVLMESIKKCEENDTYQIIEILIKINPEKAESYLTQDILRETIKNCSKNCINNLIYDIKENYPDKAKEFLTQDVIIEAVKQCNPKEIPRLMNQIKFIDEKNPEEHLTQNVFIELIKNCDKQYIVNLLDSISDFNSKILVEISESDSKIFTNLIDNKKIEIYQIPNELMENKKFVETLCHKCPEKIDNIVENCPEETLKIPEIKELVVKIKDANIENTKEQDSKEIKPKQIETNKDKEFE